VAVLGSLREQGAKCTEELREQIVAILHAQREASVEVSGRGVGRTEQDPLIPAQKIPRFGNARGNIESFESALGRKRQS
jgi:hypothetical protein